MMTDKRMSTSALGRTLLLSSNSLWNIQNFRGALVKAFDRDGWSVVIAAPPTIDQSKLVSLPARVIPLGIRRSGINPFEDLKLLWAYYRLMRAEKPAAYLGWTIKPNLYGALAARVAGVPSILNVSGLGTAFLSGRLLGQFVGVLYKFAFRKALIVYFQNPDDLELFIKKKLVSADKARLLPGSGINLTLFSSAPLPSDGGIRFLMVARLLGDKGVREYAAAAEIARRTLPNARFDLLGPIDQGNRTAIPLAELHKWTSDGAINYLGETNDVRPYIKAATVVVLPSYREGLPRSLLEGAAMGRPLIATNVPGCREIIEEGVNGFLCDVRDEISLSKAMVKLALLNVETRALMGGRSREIVERRYDENFVTEAYALALSSIKDAVT